MGKTRLSKSQRTKRSRSKISRLDRKIEEELRAMFGRRRGSGRRRSRFGKISNLSSIMGNNNGNDMSQFQIYTGMSPSQMQNHLDGIPSNLRDTFYANSV